MRTFECESDHKALTTTYNVTTVGWLETVTNLAKEVVISDVADDEVMSGQQQQQQSAGAW